MDEEERIEDLKCRFYQDWVEECLEAENEA